MEQRLEEERTRIENEIRGLKEQYQTQVEMREKMEMKSQSGVSQALNRDMKISMLIRFLKVMDCSLTVTDNSTGETFEISE